MINFESWFAGLTDGEGSFFISIWKHPKTKFGVALRPEFSITMHKQETPMLGLIQNTLKMGKINKHRENSIAFRVADFGDCIKLAEFFNITPLVSKKIDDFKLWTECLEIMKNKRHLTKNGILEIAKIRERMNGTKNKRFITANQVEEWVKDIPTTNICDVCNKEFSSYKHMTNHRRKHSNWINKSSEVTV